jgi:hypothetical protein
MMIASENDNGARALVERRTTRSPPTSHAIIITSIFTGLGNCDPPLPQLVDQLFIPDHVELLLGRLAPLDGA